MSNPLSNDDKVGRLLAAIRNATPEQIALAQESAWVYATGRAAAAVATRDSIPGGAYRDAVRPLVIAGILPEDLR